MSLADRLTPAPQSEPAGSVEYGPDGGEFKDIRSEERFTDWDHVFQRFNLDPDAYEIEGDTVFEITGSPHRITPARIAQAARAFAGRLEVLPHPRHRVDI